MLRIDAAPVENFWLRHWPVRTRAFFPVVELLRHVVLLVMQIVDLFLVVVAQRHDRHLAPVRLLLHVRRILTLHTPQRSRRRQTPPPMLSPEKLL